jgi:hypothetical protein
LLLTATEPAVEFPFETLFTRAAESTTYHGITTATQSPHTGDIPFTECIFVIPEYGDPHDNLSDSAKDKTAQDADFSTSAEVEIPKGEAHTIMSFAWVDSLSGVSRQAKEALKKCLFVCEEGKKLLEAGDRMESNQITFVAANHCWV